VSQKGFFYRFLYSIDLKYKSIVYSTKFIFGSTEIMYPNRNIIHFTKLVEKRCNQINYYYLVPTKHLNASTHNLLIINNLSRRNLNWRGGSIVQFQMISANYYDQNKKNRPLQFYCERYDLWITSNPRLLKIINLLN
jgi:hypothetical protein